MRKGRRAYNPEMASAADRSSRVAPTSDPLVVDASPATQEALRNALETIRNSETKLRQVIDTIPTLAWCNLPDGPNEFLNKRWHEYTGLSHEQSNGWGWQVAFHPEDVPPLMEKWRELLVSGEPGEMEARLRRHDGVYRWFLIRVEPFRDEHGQLVRWYGTSTDIDALKQTQEKLREEEQELPDYRRDTANDCCAGPLRRSSVREPGDTGLHGFDSERRGFSGLPRTNFSRRRPRETSR